ncbi:MAG: type II toxin-antitoxin system HicB family antitoxin [Actinomycetota bacterium]|nr:type II toxin-antitoxin system HicB family antitoxin [Actinomycetota bacterium]
MQLRPFVEGLQADLEEIAAVGDDSVAEAARRLTAAVGASAGLRLLDALGEAALELTNQLPSGHVEIRLSGQDPALVYVDDEAESTAPPSGAEDALVARISLRLPEGLKSSVEAAASREGVSVNAWLVRALTRAVGSGGGGRRGPGNRLTGFGRS